MSSIMHEARPHYLVFVIQFIFIILSPSVGYSAICNNGEPWNCTIANDPSPADCSTVLIEEVQGLDYDHVPIILIHGIHGNGIDKVDDICDPNEKYFSNLMGDLKSKGLTSHYKLYRFHYESDKYPVSEIAKSMRNKIERAFNCYSYENDNDPNNNCSSSESQVKNVPLVIIAHSMGGLVARSFMQEYEGYDRTLKLLTLATPHHGTPGANDEDTLEAYYTNQTWDQVFSISQLAYNLSSATTGSKWDVTMNSDSPNRSDLRWDSEISPILPFDTNGWLKLLNDSLTPSLAEKIIGYYGYVDPYSAGRFYWEDPSAIIFWSPSIRHFGDHTKLTIMSAIMDAGLSELFPLNDGMVPSSSGMGEYLGFGKTHPFPGHDHLDMKDGLYDNGSMLLFEEVKTDLDEVYSGIPYSSNPVYVLDSVIFDGTKVAEVYGASGNIVYQWNFGDGGIGNGPTPTYVYRASGPKTVTLTISDDSGNDYGPLTVDITVKPYPIDVSYPDNDTESVTLNFSTPDSPCGTQSSPCITEYLWNYGDGSPPVNVRTPPPHTYSPNYYTISLTLTLDDSSTITSERGLFVGSGTRYIQGHTIYGDETWFSGGVYEVQGSIVVAEGGSLTIQPNTTIKMKSGANFRVYGILAATGATFTWADGANPWRGIWFDGPGSSGSRLENCVIEGASGLTNPGTRGVVYIFDASPTITGCTINNSAASYGIYLSNSASEITNNTISGHTAYGVLFTNNSSPLIAGNTLSGNNYGIQAQYGNNNPIISGNTYSNNTEADLYATGTINSAIDWDLAGSVRLPSISIAEGASLTIHPGVIVEVNNVAQIRVDGTLIATGVTFTQGGTNYWKGIWFYGPGSSGSRLEGCVIEGASGVTTPGTRGVVHISNASPTITECTINNSAASYGIYLSNSASEITNNTISGHTAYGVLFTNNSSPLIAGNTLSGNNYGIQAQYGNNNPIISGNTYSNNTEADLYATGTINSAIDWDLAGSVRLPSISIAEGASLTIHPGVIVEVNNVAQIRVDGTLIATGVTFTQGGTNYWKGIWFYGPGSSGSRLEGCVIEGASGVTTPGTRGVVHISNASPTITECTINNSAASYGIYLSNSASEITNNTISGHTAYGVFVSSSSYPLVTGNTISGNNSYGLYYAGSSIIDATNNDWGDPSGPLDDSNDVASDGFYNPGGLGDRVSDNVIYYPWIGITHSDVDVDGLSDQWETVHFGDLATADSTSDYDGDGLPDLDEYLKGTNPKDSDSDDDVIIDFGSSGIWVRMNNMSWAKLHPANPDSITTNDIDGNDQDEVIIDFGSSGIWVRINNTAWIKLHPSNPDTIATGDMDNNNQDEVIIDFGLSGIWVRMNNSSWAKLHPSNPDSITTGDMDGNGQDDVIIDFGSSGIWVRMNNTAWVKLHPSNPDTIATGDMDGNGQDEVFVDFGASGIWVWMNNASWSKLHPSNPDGIYTGDMDGIGQDEVIIDFGASGIWVGMNDTSWSKLHPSNPDSIATGDMDGSGQDDVIIDFGSSGLWVRYNNATWKKLHGANCELMATGNLDDN